MYALVKGRYLCLCEQTLTGSVKKWHSALHNFYLIFLPIQRAHINWKARYHTIRHCTGCGRFRVLDFSKNSQARACYPPNHSTGNFCAGITGWLGYKVIWMVMDDDCFPNDLVDGKLIGQK